MDEITLYSYRSRGGGKKEQKFITINCKEKSFKTNFEQKKFSHNKYGFSCYELKDYSELQDLERCLKLQKFKEEKL